MKKNNETVTYDRTSLVVYLIAFIGSIAMQVMYRWHYEYIIGQRTQYYILCILNIMFGYVFIKMAFGPAVSRKMFLFVYFTASVLFFLVIERLVGHCGITFKDIQTLLRVFILGLLVATSLLVTRYYFILLSRKNASPE